MFLYQSGVKEETPRFDKQHYILGDISRKNITTRIGQHFCYVSVCMYVSYLQKDNWNIMKEGNLPFLSE